MSPVLLPTKPLNLFRHEAQQRVECRRTSFKRRKPVRAVQFSQVEIRIYDVTLGDNPSCQLGPPLSLSWDFTELPALRLDAYELAKGRCRTRRELVLSSDERFSKLSDVPESEINRTMREMKTIKRHREGACAENQGNALEPKEGHAETKITRMLRRKGLKELASRQCFFEEN